MAASTSGSSGSTGPTVASVAGRTLHPDNGAHVDAPRPSLNSAVDEMYKPFLDEWDRGFVEGREEAEGYFLECVQGEVPADLTGTLFRCAPKACFVVHAAALRCLLALHTLHQGCRVAASAPLCSRSRLPACRPRRNGPGKFKVGGQELGHPYDGDGLIHSIAFKAGRAYCRARFVQTAE